MRADHQCCVLGYFSDEADGLDAKGYRDAGHSLVARKLYSRSGLRGSGLCATRIFVTAARGNGLRFHYRSDTL